MGAILTTLNILTTFYIRQKSTTFILMRILEINTEKTWRGGERQTLFGLQGFTELGNEVELLCLENFPLHLKAKEAGYKFQTVGSHSGTISFLFKNGKDYDILHVQTSKQLTYALLTKPFHRSKIVYARRVDFVPKGWLTQLKYKACDKIICVSAAIQNILTQVGITKNTAVIYDCVEEKKLNTDRAKTFVQASGIKDKTIIGTTAALVPHKDPMNLVRAINHLKTLRQDFIVLHFGDGPLRENVAAYIKEHQLENYIRLCGFVNEVEDYFSVFNLFVMSSEEEGLGSSVLDAFTYKVPVVSTNAGGLAELVKGRGYVVEKRNPVALAEGLNEAISNNTLTKSYTDAAYQYVSTELTIKVIHEKHIKIFNELLQLL
jgi:glycosyltransferase involved in cell wall biosynthesis